MGKTFNLTQEPFEKGQKMFKNGSVTINPGVTILVGCNGAGKTTMLRQIEAQLKESGDPYISFDNRHEGGSDAMSRYGFYQQFEELATMFCSSEGEQIMVVLGEYARKIGNLARTNRESDIFILLDAVDSGFSIDNIDELKRLLFKTVIEDHPKDVYIICTANSYEMARKEKCIDVMTCDEISFVDYEKYRDFIIKTKKQKEKRDK